MKKFISVLLLLCIVLSLFSCVTESKDDEKKRNREISGFYFNTYSQISTYNDDSDEKIESYVKTADEVLSYYHKLFDIYFEYSGINNIKTINKNAGKAPVVVDKELLVFLEYCKELYTFTGGKTNVMFGSVLKIWHDCRELAEEGSGYLDPSLLPTADALAEAAKHTSIDSLVIDREASTVYITDPHASIDVGAIAKGYTVDVLYKRLLADGADSTVLNIGGNIRTIGLKPNGERWVTGLKNPDYSSDEPLICRLKLGSVSLVTSGDYERYFVSGDVNYHHIIDTATLYPARYFSSVSILADNSGLADALSTALFCMPYEQGLALIESLEDVEAIWVYADGTVKSTKNVEFYSEK